MTHTPGPWRWENAGRSPVRLVAPCGYVMDFVRHGMADAQPRFRALHNNHIMAKTATVNINEFPDARLIAAAPDMLAALKDLMAQLSGMEKSCGHSFYCRCPTESAAAAIAKAEGESK